jgi:hypothetical protein
MHALTTRCVRLRRRMELNMTVGEGSDLVSLPSGDSSTCRQERWIQ